MNKHSLVAFKQLYRSRPIYKVNNGRVHIQPMFFMKERIDTDTYYLDVMRVITNGIILHIPFINHEGTVITNSRHVGSRMKSIWEHFLDISPDTIHSCVYSDFACAYPSMGFGGFCDTAMKTDLAFADAEYLLTCRNILLKEYQKHNRLSIHIPNLDGDFAHRSANIIIPLRRM